MAATGVGTLTYQWQKNGVNIINGGHYSGATTSTLAITGASSSDSGQYRCMVSNEYGSVESNSATLTVFAGPPAAPSLLTASANGTDKITWRWVDLSTEMGYRVKDSGGVNKSGDLAANTTAWQETGLAPNTRYTRFIHAYNTCGESAPSAGQSCWTNSAPPGEGSVAPDKGFLCTNGMVTWTAVGGFGAGTVQYYRYAWDQSPTHGWTGSEPQWSSGTLQTTASAPGVWYLHVRGYNGANVFNGAYNYSVTVNPTVRADFDGDCDVDGTDASVFLACMTGAGQPYDGQNLPAGCQPTLRAGGVSAADLDLDLDIDQSDFGAFQKCLSGPASEPDPNCED